jgi:hypothetical protein
MSRRPAREDALWRSARHDLSEMPVTAQLPFLRPAPSRAPALSIREDPPSVVGWGFRIGRIANNLSLFHSERLGLISINRTGQDAKKLQNVRKQKGQPKTEPPGEARRFL